MTMTTTMQVFAVLHSGRRIADMKAVVSKLAARHGVFRHATVSGYGARADIAAGGMKVRVLQALEPAHFCEGELTPLRTFDPSDAIAAQAARTSIVVEPPARTVMNALTAAKIGLVLAEAIRVETGNALAIHAGASGAFVPASDLAPLIETFERGDVPHEFLIQYAPFYPRNEGLDGTVGVLTRGLLPIVGAEVAIAPRLEPDLIGALQTARRTAYTLVVSGSTICDGQELFDPSGLRLTARVVPEWVVKGVPVVVLVAPDSVVETEHLTVRRPGAPRAPALVSGRVGDYAGPSRKAYAARLPSLN